MAIGTFSPPVTAPDLLGNARAVVDSLDQLLLQAHHIANSVISGWHGRRRQGRGDSFWQFRPYQPGEASSVIDWRRSARGDVLYSREREWEAAQTVFLCLDIGCSMRYQSRFALHSKQERALLLALILAELLSKAGERIAVPHILLPTRTNHGAERLALALYQAQGQGNSFDFSQVSLGARAIIISDFLEEYGMLQEQFALLSQHHVQAHLVEIVDPAEERFPYHGDIEFSAPKGGEKIRLGRADHLRDDYQKLYLAHRTHVKASIQPMGWSFYTSVTDQPLAPTLHHLYFALTGLQEGRAL